MLCYILIIHNHLDLYARMYVYLFCVISYRSTTTRQCSQGITRRFVLSPSVACPLDYRVLPSKFVL